MCWTNGLCLIHAECGGRFLLTGYHWTFEIVQRTTWNNINRWQTDYQCPTEACWTHNTAPDNWVLLDVRPYPGSLTYTISWPRAGVSQPQSGALSTNKSNSEMEAISGNTAHWLSPHFLCPSCFLLPTRHSGQSSLWGSRVALLTCFRHSVPEGIL